MKKSLAILLIFSLLSPYLVSAQTDPCQDKEFLRLKDVNINDMSDREYKYFMMMSEKCADEDVSATMQDIYAKEKEDKDKRTEKASKDFWVSIEILIIFLVLLSWIDSFDNTDQTTISWPVR